MIRFASGHLVVEISIVCAAGERPRLVLESLGEGLSFCEWGVVRDAIDEAWRALDIACTCGHSFVMHLSRSPHPCYSVCPSCSCPLFTAAEPLYRNEASR